jgi:hypothetical protein
VGVKKSEKKAFQLLYLRYIRHQVMVANVVLPDYGECDVLSVSPGGYLYEFEIKDTRADFLSELRNKEEKHAKFQAGYCPKFFYFVTTEARMIEVNELPPRMGLLEITGATIEMKVKAGKAHSEKVSLETMTVLANRLTRRLYGIPLNTYRRAQ